MCQLESTEKFVLDGQIVLGTTDDLKKEHDWLLARVHRLRDLLKLPPLLTGKKQRQHDSESIN